MSRVEPRELRRYRQFYLVYSRIWESPTPEFVLAGTTLITSVLFTHLNELIAIDDPLKRAFYEVECIRGSWSVRELKRQIGSLYFERSGLSKDKEKLAAGRFFEPLSGDPARYVLKADGLPLALGLSLVSVAMRAHRNRKDIASELSKLLDPIAALDRTGDVLMSALLTAQRVVKTVETEVGRIDDRQRLHGARSRCWRISSSFVPETTETPAWILYGSSRAAKNSLARSYGPRTRRRPSWEAYAERSRSSLPEWPAPPGSTF
jgi:DUF1016 N-terminal domain